MELELPAPQLLDPSCEAKDSHGAGLGAGWGWGGGLFWPLLGLTAVIVAKALAFFFM